MTLPRDLVIEVLRDPARCTGWSLREWDLLVRQARSAGLLARIAWTLKDQGLRPDVPAAPAVHLDAALNVADAQHAEVRREVAQIRQALAPLGIRIVLLKGAAYVMAGLPAARGRIFSDVDILVPRESLPDVEAELMKAGWATTHHNAYDQRYYRVWMHELPPMVHMRRQTALDVHHAIAPLTGRWRPSSSALLQAAVQLPGEPHLTVLAPVDMVLHSMVHLLLNDELSNAMRDLSDIDLLLRRFATDPGFWHDLSARAKVLGLTRAAGHGLLQATRTLGIALPEDLQRLSAEWAPASWSRSLLHASWKRAFQGPHESACDFWTAPALKLLYLHAHWLRMPPSLLLRHLTVKALHLHLDRKAVKPGDWVAG